MSRTAAEANLEYVAEAFERWNAGEREIEFERIDPEVELHTSRLDPGRTVPGP